jgi:hypothetical protein
MRPNKTIIKPVISMAIGVESTFVNANPMETKNKINAPVKKNIPISKRIKAMIKEKKLILDCSSSALTSSIIARNISTKEVTVYFSE